MKIIKAVLPILLAVITVTSCNGNASTEQANSTQIPKEVKDVVGTYTGSWTIYGLDANGQVIKQMAWTETLK
ncbi:MAG TPA: hypothetical protein VGW09_04625, partial [Nitrososphaeraceae archaeon]|nr:hypothetical protein [Nitrososphaeraceae archaeon]